MVVRKGAVADLKAAEIVDATAPPRFGVGTGRVAIVYSEIADRQVATVVGNLDYPESWCPLPTRDSCPISFDRQLFSDDGQSIIAESGVLVGHGTCEDVDATLGERQDISGVG